jgi:hypothetical protein
MTDCLRLLSTVLRHRNSSLASIPHNRDDDAGLAGVRLRQDDATGTRDLEVVDTGLAPPLQGSLAACCE